MENFVLIKFDVVPSQPSQPLGIKISIDDQEAWSTQALAQRQQLEFRINDTVEKSHVMVWQLFGKTAEHTKIDDTGKIISDSLISIENLSVDDIAIDNYIPDICSYKHDFNGTAQPTEEKFYGHMGCNGTVTMLFSTPVYLWMLEKM